MLSKRDKVMSNVDTVFVQSTLRQIYTTERFGSVKAAQVAAYDYLRARVTGHRLTLRRVRAMFEGKANIIRGEEKDAVRAAHIEEAGNERRILLERLQRLDQLLAAVGTDGAGPLVPAPGNGGSLQL